MDRGPANIKIYKAYCLAYVALFMQFTDSGDPRLAVWGVVA